jgi:SAM-dependent methyltransferase
MSKLYTELAWAYHEMYQTIFDYQAQYALFEGLIREHGCRSVLEIGCGSGNLYPYFVEGGYAYTGLDLSHEMLAIARSLHPDGRFLQGDMRDFDLRETFDAVLITGRSFTYMTLNTDVHRALKAIGKHLPRGGLFAFDNFHAGDIFLHFKEEMESASTCGQRTYTRKSVNTRNGETGWTWNWHATYTIEEPGKETRVIEDTSVLRAFTPDEIALFLNINGYEVLKTLHDPPAMISLALKV